ncbi:ROK family protein [Candidatus Poribacteria bacterium]|nr:ROK family protein [Candidatus Poribacteria bacterium]
MKMPIDWNKLNDGDVAPNVFVINSDLAGSTKLATEMHPTEYEELISKLRDNIDKIFENDKRFYGDWTGDGLVVLFTDSENYADILIEKSLEIVKSVEEINTNRLPEPIRIRCGISFGTIDHFNKKIGKIISSVMNRAGHFQKYCPHNHGILMEDEVYIHIGDKKRIAGNFNSKKITIKDKDYCCYNYSGNITKEGEVTEFQKISIEKEQLPGRFFIGIDIGRNKTKYCLIDYDKYNITENLDECVLSINPDIEDTRKHQDHPVPLYVQLSEIIERLNNECIKKYQKNIDGIGLGLPGQVDPQRGYLISSPGLLLTQQNDFVDGIKSKLRNDLQKISIKIDNDVRCATRYEWKKNPQYKNLICIFVGNGLGSGIIVNSKMVYGSSFTAGEVGHTTIIDTGLCKYSNKDETSDFFLNDKKCNCNKDGTHWELLVCSYGIELMAKKCDPQAYKKLKEYCKNLENNEELKNNEKYKKYFKKYFSEKYGGLTTYAISAAYYLGENQYVKEVVEDIFLRYLGIGIANYINIINPEKIILGGGMIEGFLESELQTQHKLREYVEKYSLLTPQYNVSITPNLDEEHIASVGAALIFKDESYKF